MLSDLDVRESPRTVGLRQWRTTHAKLQGYRDEIMSALSGPAPSHQIDAEVEVFIGEDEFSRMVVSWGPARAASLARLGRDTSDLRGKSGSVGKFWPAMGASRSVRINILWGATATAADRALARDIAWGAYMAVCSYVEDPADLVRSR